MIASRDEIRSHIERSKLLIAQVRSQVYTNTDDLLRQQRAIEYLEERLHILTTTLNQSEGDA